MATYFSVPVKRTWEVDLEKPLRTFIQNTFSSISPDDYNSALKELGKLRSSVIAKAGDKHESALEVFHRYYDQLVAIEPKFPITENQIRINFKWQDAFDKESFFSGKRTLTVSSGAYEKVCVLFNIAALQSQIGEIQNPDSDEGLKTAAKLFQQASGIFTYLKDCVMSHVQNDPTPDMHPDTLHALALLMLAQAQDCFCRKTINDKMKPAVIAKVAYQCSDLYADAMKILQLQSLKELWPKDWIPSVVSKQAAFHAIAEFQQSKVSKEKKDFGEEIARLRHAKDLIAAAETRGGYTFVFADDSKRIYRALEEANKDNDFIYHAKIPDMSTLPPIGKAAIAKPLPLTAPMSGSKFTDLFDKVQPLVIQQAMVGFEARKTEATNREVGRLRESTMLLNGVLASMNLPAAIEDVGGHSVPQSVLEKASQVRDIGGIVYFNKLMTDLPELLTRNREILDESMKMLQEEQESDKQLREQFKERWTRTPSDKLTEPIKADGNKYRMVLENAVGADAIVKERYNTHKAGFEILSKSEAEISSALPAAGPGGALKDSPVVRQLRTLMEEVETIKAEREVMENELKEAKCDMASSFIEALAQDGAINEQDLSEQQLDRSFGPLRQQVTDSCQRQEVVLAKLQQANGEFCQAKAQNQSAASREGMLKDLAAAFDSFMELKSNLEEGTKFYNDLTQILVKFQSKKKKVPTATLR